MISNPAISPAPSGIEPPRDGARRNTRGAHGPQGESFSGTAEDVAAFFRKSLRTVMRWSADGVIGHFKYGNSLMFGEESVIEFYAKHFHAGTGMKPGEIEARARREWREFLGARMEDGGWQERVARIEERLGILTADEHGFSQTRQSLDPQFKKEAA